MTWPNNLASVLHSFSDTDTTGTGSSYTTASMTAKADTLYIIYVGLTAAANPSQLNSVSGGGLGSWTFVDRASGGSRGVQCFAAISSSPGAAAAVTITPAASETISSAMWSIVEIPLTDRGAPGSTFPAGAFIQSVGGGVNTNTNTNMTAVVPTLSALGKASNIMICAHVHGNTGATTAGQTPISDDSATAIACTLNVQYKSPGQTTASASWTGSTGYRFLIQEIRTTDTGLVVIQSVD